MDTHNSAETQDVDVLVFSYWVVTKSLTMSVQQFTLHEDWNVLKRYTHLRPGDVRIDSGL